jgi:prepilin-type N-terminal cleavage/methylation domain-containing protein
MNRRAFTLIEMLLATALAAVLMAAVLTMLAGVARDRRRVNAVTASPTPQPLIERIRWDLANAQTMDMGRDGGSVVLTGHGGIDHRSLISNGRLVQVTYRTTVGCLMREQEYLDSPAQPDRWREVVVGAVRSFRMTPESSDATPVDTSDGAATTVTTVPSRVRVRIESSRAGGSIDQELWIK